MKNKTLRGFLILAAVVTAGAILLSKTERAQVMDAVSGKRTSRKKQLCNMDKKELEKYLEEVVAIEDYTEAILVRDELRSRRMKS